MALARATLALRDLGEQRRGQLARLLDDHQHWSDVISGPSLGLDVARSWATTIDDGEAALRQLDGRIHDADRERSDRSLVLRGAIARTDAAETLAHKTARAAARLRDEAVLGEAADRAAQRGSWR